MPTDVVMKLMMPLLKKGHNVTSDNYFTSLNLCLRLAKQGCSLVDTIRSNRREIPNNLRETCSQHDTTIVKLADAAVARVTTTKYQCKKSKSVNIVSLLDPNVAIPIYWPNYHTIKPYIPNQYILDSTFHLLDKLKEFSPSPDQIMVSFSMHKRATEKKIDMIANYNKKKEKNKK